MPARISCDDRIWAAQLRVGHYLLVGGNYYKVEKIENLSKTEWRVTVEHISYPIIVQKDGFVYIDWRRAKEFASSPLGRIGKQHAKK